jgi:DNA modification methylase
MAKAGLRWQLCYADMMFAEKSDSQLDWIHDIRRVAAPTATLYVHTDQRSVCEVKEALRKRGWHFRAWLIWSYNWGGRPRNCWGAKHDDILMATMHPKQWTFNVKAVSIPKKTLINSTKTMQIPTDVWGDIGIVHTMSKEKDAGQHRKWQKPEKLLERIIKASSNPGDVVLDTHAGTGTTFVAAKRLGRKFIGCDTDAGAVQIAKARIAAVL